MCSKSCSELELTPESLVLGIKLFCTEMAVQAQESSRPPSTDTYMADNTTVMLKGVSVQFRKKTSENGNSLWLLLGVREDTYPECSRQGSEPCLVTGFHVPAHLRGAWSAT